ncbi:hypothetical protein DY000_02033137 [Brassica cretica]|uniref:Uncharacterized protein n=1 Tax=Brassica cretica TaxID=69181 RepID=A0ABQ7DNK6_BRACR|nr:hypothetical protein DY000_02033137 [Brassica cretica]
MVVVEFAPLVLFQNTSGAHLLRSLDLAHMPLNIDQFWFSLGQYVLHGSALLLFQLLVSSSSGSTSLLKMEMTVEALHPRIDTFSLLKCVCSYAVVQLGVVGSCKDRRLSILCSC